MLTLRMHCYEVEHEDDLRLTLAALKDAGATAVEVLATDFNAGVVAVRVDVPDDPSQPDAGRAAVQFERRYHAMGGC